MSASQPSGQQHDGAGGKEVPQPPPPQVSNFTGFDFAEFQATRAAQGADLIRANAAALFSSDESSSSSEDDDDEKGVREARRSSADRAGPSSRERSRSRSRSRDRRRASGHKHKKDRDKDRKRNKSRRKRSRSRSSDRGKGKRRRSREAVPAEVLRPLLTLQPNERRSGVARWLPPPDPALQPALGDVWFLDPQPDRDNVIFGRLHPTDVPRYRRTCTSDALFAVTGPRKPQPAAKPRGNKPATMGLGQVLVYQKGGTFALTEAAREAGYSLRDYFNEDGEFLAPNELDGLRYYGFRANKTANWTRPVHPPAAGAAHAGVSSSSEDFIPLPRGDEGAAAQPSGAAKGGEPEAEGARDPLMEQSRELNVRVREHPTDIPAWLQLSKLQDALAAGNRIRSRAGLAAVAEKRLAILSKALEANPNHVGLIRSYMRLWSESAEPSECNDRWAQVVRRRPGDPRMWSDLLALSLGRLGAFKVEDSRRSLLRALEDLAWERDRVVMDNRGARAEELAERRAVDALLRLLEFDLASGYAERFVAGCQALLEFEFLAPPAGLPECRTLEDRLLLFADFWRSRRPRLGEAQGQGFKFCLRASWRDAQPSANASATAPATVPPALVVPAFSLRPQAARPGVVGRGREEGPLVALVGEEDEEDPWKRKRRPPPGAPRPPEKAPSRDASPPRVQEEMEDAEDELDRLLREAEEEAVRSRLAMKLEGDIASLSADEGGLTLDKLRRYVAKESERESEQWLPKREVSEDDPIGPDRHVSLEDVHPLLIGLRYPQSKTRLLLGILSLWGLEVEGLDAAYAARPRALGHHAGLPWYLSGGTGRQEFVVRALRLLLDQSSGCEDVGFLVAEALVLAVAGRAGWEGADAGRQELADAEGALRSLLSSYRDHPFLWLAYAQLQSQWAANSPKAVKTFRKMSGAVISAVNASSWQAAAWAVFRLVGAETRTASQHPSEARTCGDRCRSLLLSLGHLAYMVLEVKVPKTSDVVGFQTAPSEDNRILARRGYQTAVSSLLACKGQLPKDASPRDPSCTSADPMQLSLYGASWVAAMALTEAFLGESEAATAALNNTLSALRPTSSSSGDSVWSGWAKVAVLEGLGWLSIEPSLQLPGARVLTAARARTLLEQALHILPPTQAPPRSLLSLLEEMDRRAFAQSRTKARLAQLWAKRGALLDEDTWATEGHVAEDAQRAFVPLLVAHLTASVSSAGATSAMEAVGTRHMFERALQHECIRQVPLVWALYIAFECSRGARSNTNSVLLRGLSHCPWSKDLWLLGLKAALGMDTTACLRSLLRSPGLMGTSPVANPRKEEGAEAVAFASAPCTTVKESHALLEAMRAKGLLVRTDIYEVLLEELEVQMEGAGS